MGILHWEVLGYMGVWDGGVAWFGNLGHWRGCDRDRLAIENQIGECLLMYFSLWRPVCKNGIRQLYESFRHLWIKTLSPRP